MKTVVKNYIPIVIVLLMCSVPLFAQVGLDNPLPSSYSTLDMKADNKGILIPKMTKKERFALLNTCAPNCPDGLMVYDTVQLDFFFLSKNQWYALSAFATSDTSLSSAEPAQMNLGIFSSVGIGVVPQKPYILDVLGNVKHSSKTNEMDTLIIKKSMNVISGDVNVTGGGLTVAKGNYYSSGNFTAKDFNSADTAQNSNGPIPKGGIIMWSGSIASIPKGWALCNGQNGTPRLSDLFIAGAGDTGGKYVVGASGGEKEHLLTLQEMPAHSHSGTTSTNGSHSHSYKGTVGVSSIPFACDGPDRPSKSVGKNSSDPLDYMGEAAGDHTHDIIYSVNTGGGQPHENRPPYYALAYIMKL